jgi:O-antigen ligase
VSLNGFFLYLALLDALDVRPRTAFTAGYYALLGSALLLTAWYRRDVLLRRAQTRLARVFTTAAAALAVWFLASAALLSDGSLARELGALLVLWSLPTALVVAALERGEVSRFALCLVALALVFVSIEAIALLRTEGEVFRFSPIAHLDPITAALVPAIGAVAALAIFPARRGWRPTAVVVTAVLVGASIVPGSRGPLIALAGACLAVLALRGRRYWLGACAALATGVTLGLLVSAHIGAYGYLSAGLSPSSPVSSAETRDVPDREISTLAIRRQWLEDALRAIPDEPLLGHGVGMLEDTTPEARLMGVYGQRTYPHNALVEAAYSLGVVGVVAYLTLLGCAAFAVVGILRGRHDRGRIVVLGLGVFAFVSSNISGEIGADAMLWATAALAVGLHADQSLETAARSAGPTGRPTQARASS